MDENKYELITLKDVFDGGKRSFEIPEYQRGYSWEAKQRDDLIKDIENLTNQNYKHYTGTIVASKNNGENTFNIVDGQQRLTSIIILLARLHQEKKCSDKIQKEIQEIFIASRVDTGNCVRKFKLNSLLDNFFYKCVTEGCNSDDKPTKSHHNIFNAFDEFQKWLQKLDFDRDEIYKTITERLGFLLYAPKNDSEIGIMFEVINNRGKPLSELEKIKNYLIYFAEKNKKKDLKDAVNISWEEILKNLNTSKMTSNDDENSFLRNCWIVFADTNKSRSYKVYDNLKIKYPANVETHWKELQVFVKFLESASKTYKKLHGTNNGNDLLNENKWLQYISLHANNASIIPLIIAIYEKEKERENIVTMLELLEKFNFRYYGCNIANRADTGQGGLFLWAHYFYNNYKKTIDGKKINTEWLKKQIYRLIESDADDRKFVQYLTLDNNEDYDYYNWNSLRFFLANYEEKLLKEKKKSIDLLKMLAPQDKNAKNNYFQKEHIWATKDRTIDNIQDDDINKRRLGNFVLLEPSINNSVSNNTVEQKIKDYYNTQKSLPGTYMLHELEGFYEKSKNFIEKNRTNKTWKYRRDVNQKFLDLRESKLIKFALERWRVDELNNNITSVTINSFVSDKNENYSIK